MLSEMQIVQKHAAVLPVNVQAIIEELGIVYLEEPMDPASSGRIDYNDPFCTITINSLEGPQRRRFTAAHELGHYLLHRDLMDGKGHLDRLYSEGGRDNPYAPLSPEHEVQANQFAASLLMPEKILRSRYDRANDNVRELADLCAVSPMAMRIRLKNIGIREHEHAQG